MAIQFNTVWSHPPTDGEVDMARHAAFESMAREILETAMPDLHCFLDSVNASVVAGGRFFTFSAPYLPHVWHPVPQMACRLALLPWVDAHEVAH